MKPSGLARFKNAQNDDYQTALAEIRNGRKRSHWMWYIFPQLAGLGQSDTARYFAIKDLREAAAYLKDKQLRTNLIAICRALLNLQSRDAHDIFGSPDDLKLRSCMTLFEQVSGAPPVFGQVLDEFFAGKRDQKTLDLLGIKKATD